MTFAANLAALRARGGRAARLADRAEAAADAYEIVPSRTADPTARRSGRFVLSPRDPRGEAAQRAARLAENPPSAAVVLGFGLGYLLEAARAAAPSARAFLGVVSSPGALRSALAARDLAPLLTDPRVDLILAEEADFAAFADLLDEAASVRYAALSEPEVLAEVPEAFRSAARAMAEVAEVRQKSLATLSSFASLWIRRLLENADLLAASQGWNALLAPRRAARAGGFGPLALVAAGPSLVESVARIPTAAADRLVAVDTALPVLAARGIRPLLAVTADAQQETEGHFRAAGDGVAARALLAAPFVPRTVLARAGARRYLVPVEEPSVAWFLRRLGIDAPPLRSGGTVLSFAWGLARALGADPILFFGADFAVGATTHARGTAYDDWRTAAVSRFASRETVERGVSGAEEGVGGGGTLAQYARWFREEIAASSRAGGPRVRAFHPTPALGLSPAGERDVALLAEAPPVELPPLSDASDRAGAADAEAVRTEARARLAAAAREIARGATPDEIVARHADGPAGIFLRPLAVAATPAAARTLLDRILPEIEALS